MQTDQKLQQTLRVWQPSPPAAPDFNHAVWRRVAAEEDRGLSGMLARLGDWLVVQLPRPAYASALLLATALLGTAVARLEASHARERYREQSARRYLDSIDPISMMESTPRSTR